MLDLNCSHECSCSAKCCFCIFGYDFGDIGEKNVSLIYLLFLKDVLVSKFGEEVKTREIEVKIEIRGTFTEKKLLISKAVPQIGPSSSLQL